MHGYSSLFSDRLIPRRAPSFIGLQVSTRAIGAQIVNSIAPEPCQSVRSEISLEPFHDWIASVRSD